MNLLALEGMAALWVLLSIASTYCTFAGAIGDRLDGFETLLSLIGVAISIFTAVCFCVAVAEKVEKPDKPLPACVLVSPVQDTP